MTIPLMETLQKIREKKINQTDPFLIMWPTKLTNPSLQKTKKTKKHKKIKIPPKTLVGFCIVLVDDKINDVFDY
jgi:hypothetical protein